jgi:hypothetical protein
VLPIVSSAVFLSVRPSLIAVRFSSSSQLLSRGFSFRHDGGKGGRWKREKEGEEVGKARVTDQTAGMTERASTPLSICLSDPQRRDEAVAQEGAQNSVKKGSPFWDPSKVSVHASHEALTLHSPCAHPGSPWLTLLVRCECLKRHGVSEREGELGADFSSVHVPEILIEWDL